MRANRAVALGRWLVAAALFSAIVWQIEDRLVHNLFRPAEYFSYFSIQGTLIATVMMAYTGWLAWNKTPEDKRVTIARLSTATYVSVIALAYNALLRGGAPDVRDIGYQWPVIPNEIIHVWGPIFVVLDWLLIAGFSSLRLRAAFWVAVYPVCWLVFSVVRGMVDGWWAYWFLDPTDDGGVLQMLGYTFGLTALMIGLGFFYLSLRTALSRFRRANK